MANKYKRFTQEDFAVIKRCLQTYPTQREAFQQASRELNRTFDSIRMCYSQHSEFDDIRKDRKCTENERKDNIKKVLVEEINKCPTNLQEAFRRTSDRTGLGTTTIRNNYYKKGTYINRQDIGICFALSTGKKTVYNSKNTTKNQPKVSKTKTNKFIEFFKNLFK